MINVSYSEDNETTWKQLKASGDILAEWGSTEIWTADDGFFGPYKWYPEHVQHNILIKAFWIGDDQYGPSECTVQTLKVNLTPNPPVSILSHESFVDSIETFWVTAEIENVGAANLAFVRITAVYYDPTGKIVCTDGCYADLHLLAPGEKSSVITFAGISYPSDHISASTINSYSLDVRAYRETTEEPYRDFEINSTGWFNEYGGYQVSGDLKNTGEISVEYVDVTATFYRADGTIVDAWWDPSDPNKLDPNQTATFSIYARNLEEMGLIDHYAILVDSYPVMTSSSISCAVSPSETRLGESVTVSGLISPVHEMANVTLIYFMPDATSMRRTVLTDNEGFYNVTFAPDKAGAWAVHASWPGDIDTYGAVSPEVSFRVSKIMTSISCSVSSATIQLGEKITVTGSMFPTLESVNAALTFTRPDGSTINHSIALAHGEYTFTYEPDSSGSWSVKASWSGNDNYERNSSGLIVFTVEFTAPMRQIPPPENTAVALAVGTSVTVGLTASMSLSGFAQSFSDGIAKLPLPKWFKDFLNLYAEKTFENLNAEELKALKRKRIVTLRELLSLLFSGMILLAVFLWVEVGGIPNLLSSDYVFAALPQVLISVVFVFSLSQIFSLVSAKVLNVWSEFKIWLYGLAALLITGIVLMIPFASPGKVEYQGDLDRKKAGLIASSKILCILILAAPFYFFQILGFPTIADAGLMMTMMTACYSTFPSQPLEGRAIFTYNKSLWITIFLLSFSIFICTIFNLLPPLAYLFIGTTATILFLALILTLKRKREASA